MNNFMLYRTAPNSYPSNIYFIKDAAPEIEQLIVSDDGKYICLRLSPKTTSYYDCNIKINDKLWTLESCSYSYDYIEYYLYNETAIKETSYNIEITKKDASTKLLDVMGQEYDSVVKTISTPVDSTITATSATLDLSDKILKLTLSGNCSDVYSASYACQYVVTIDGVDYRLIGRLSQDYSIPSTVGAVFSFDSYNLFDIDLSKLTTATTATLSLSILSTDTSSYNGFREASGKPMEAFTVNVTITE
jgi:hypothetical protein